MSQERIFLYALCLSLTLSGGIPDDWQERATLIGDWLLLTWTIAAFNLLVGGSLNQLGIRPREPVGLLGVVFAPFLHVDSDHLVGNSLSFVILGWLTLIQGIPTFYVVSLVIAITGGLGTWLFGRARTCHVGASTITFGYRGYLLVNGFLNQDGASVLLAVFVGFFYWKKVLSMLPGESGMSWEGHLFGFLGGALAAQLLSDLEAGMDAVG